MDAFKMDGVVRGSFAALVLTVLLTVGCSHNSGSSRVKKPSPKKQLEAIVTDLRRGLAAHALVDPRITVARDQSTITGEIDEGSEPLTATITLEFTLTVQVTPRVPSEDAPDDENDAPSHPFLEDFTDEPDPLAVDIDPPVIAVETPKGRKPVTEPIFQNDGFKDEVQLTFEQGQWVLKSDPEWESIRIAFEHALSVQ